MATRFYIALESVCIASALSNALTIYPRQIRVHQRLNSSFLQLWRRSGGRPQRIVYPLLAVTCQHCETHCVSGHRTYNLPIVIPMRYHLCYRDDHQSKRCHKCLVLVVSSQVTRSVFRYKRTYRRTSCRLNNAFVSEDLIPALKTIQS